MAPLLKARVRPAWAGLEEASLEETPRTPRPLPYQVPTAFPAQALTVSCVPLCPQEIKVLQEIQLLQVAASNYYFKRDEEFGVWFRSVEYLTEKER